MTSEWQNKHLLITGGTRGLGLACVKQFLSLGAQVYFTYVRSQRISKEIMGSYPLTAHAFHLNLANPESILTFSQQLSLICPKLDCALFSAASGVFTDLTQMTRKQFDYSFQCNVYGLSSLITELEPKLMPNGSVLTVTSQGSTKPLQKYGPLGIAKAAMEELTRGTAARLAYKGIRANCVMPGPFLTDSLRKLPGYEQRLSRFNAAKILKKSLEISDIVPLIEFMLSDRSKMITGEVIRIDGGAHLQLSQGT